MTQPKEGQSTVNRGNAGKGRPKGSKNKTTTLLKDAILKAAEEAGGKDGMIGYLREQAVENPGPFMSLLGKVLPTQVVGDPDQPIVVESPGESLIAKLDAIASRASSTSE